MIAYDFRGGYTSNLPPETVPANMLLAGTNLFWKGKLKKRPGFVNLDITDTGNNINASEVVGMCEVLPTVGNGIFLVLALDDQSAVTVEWYSSPTGKTQAPPAGGGGQTATTYGYNPIAGTKFTLGTNDLWEITSGNGLSEYNLSIIPFPGSPYPNLWQGYSALGTHLNLGATVVVLNGLDRPKVFFGDPDNSTVMVCDLEEYDIREWAIDQWKAGQYTASGGTYTDDTTDAQDDGAADFQVFSTTNDDGMYVSCVNPFNVVLLDTFAPSAAAGDITVEYYAGNDTWTALTVDYSRWTQNHTGGHALTASSSGTVYLHFNLPFDADDGTLMWEKYGDLSTQTEDDLLNRYVLRITAGTAPASASSCTKLRIFNTQYLSQILLNVKPQAGCVHKNRLFLAAENAFRFSPPNSLTGWYSNDIELCPEGGPEILQLVSCGEYLAALKGGAIYGHYGTTTQNFLLRKIDAIGAISRTGAAYLGNVLVYVASDGIRAMVNEQSVRLTRHIQSDYDGLTTKSTALCLNWDGNMFVSFPDHTTFFWMDPDTIRQSEADAGEGLASFWKWTGPEVRQGFYSENNVRPILAEVDPDGLDVSRIITTTESYGYDRDWDDVKQAIAVTFQTPYRSDDIPGQRKKRTRLAVEITASGVWTLTLLADDGTRSAAQSISSGSGEGIVRHDTEIPYDLDGYNFSVKLENNTQNRLQIRGVTDEMKRRPF